MRPILAEFAPVPNAHPVEGSTIAIAPVSGAAAAPQPQAGPPPVPARVEVGGPPGPEPTRFGDWERNGRCIDF